MLAPGLCISFKSKGYDSLDKTTKGDVHNGKSSYYTFDYSNCNNDASLYIFVISLHTYETATALYYEIICFFSPLVCSGVVLSGPKTYNSAGKSRLE